MFSPCPFAGLVRMAKGQRPKSPYISKRCKERGVSTEGGWSRRHTKGVRGFFVYQNGKKGIEKGKTRVRDNQKKFLSGRQDGCV